jgi:hypothetical protein
MTVVAALFSIGVFMAITALIVKFSGRRHPGDITGPKGNEIDYDNPYPGWSMWSSREIGPSLRREQRVEPRYRDDFEQWETELSHDREQ